MNKDPLAPNWKRERPEEWEHCCSGSCDQGRRCPNRKPSGPRWIGEVVAIVSALASVVYLLGRVHGLW